MSSLNIAAIGTKQMRYRIYGYVKLLLMTETVFVCANPTQMEEIEKKSTLRLVM